MANVELQAATAMLVSVVGPHQDRVPSFRETANAKISSDEFIEFTNLGLLLHL